MKRKRNPAGFSPWFAIGISQKKGKFLAASDRGQRVSPFKARKNRCLLYLTKLNSNIQKNVSIKKILKSLKATDLFRKTYCQMKDNKPRRCHNLGPGRILWGSVAATAHVEARFSFTCNSIFCLHRAL